MVQQIDTMIAEGRFVPGNNVDDAVHALLAKHFPRTDPAVYFNEWRGHFSSQLGVGNIVYFPVCDLSTINDSQLAAPLDDDLEGVASMYRGVPEGVVFGTGSAPRSRRRGGRRVFAWGLGGRPGALLAT